MVASSEILDGDSALCTVLHQRRFLPQWAPRLLSFAPQNGDADISKRDPQAGDLRDVVWCPTQKTVWFS